jgi:hypothetical protein
MSADKSHVRRPYFSSRLGDDHNTLDGSHYLVSPPTTVRTLKPLIHMQSQSQVGMSATTAVKQFYKPGRRPRIPLSCDPCRGRKCVHSRSVSLSEMLTGSCLDSNAIVECPVRIVQLAMNVQLASTKARETGPTTIRMTTAIQCKNE